MEESSSTNGSRELGAAIFRERFLSAISPAWHEQILIDLLIPLKVRQGFRLRQWPLFKTREPEEFVAQLEPIPSSITRLVLSISRRSVISGQWNLLVGAKHQMRSENEIADVPVSPAASAGT